MNSIANYRRHLKKELRCPLRARKILLAKFDAMLENYLEDSPNPDEHALLAAFGPPEEMARLFKQEISERDHSQYLIRKRFQKLAALTLVIFWIVFTIFVYFQKEIPVTIINEGYYENTVSYSEDMP